MPAGNAKFLMDSVFELSQRINSFKLADAEIGLFSSVVIIAAGKRENQHNQWENFKLISFLPDRPGLRNPEIVSQMQSKLKVVLQNILASQHPENNTIFSELVTILHDLRTLNTLHTEKFLQQARVTGEAVRVRTASPPASSLQHHLLYGAGSDWEGGPTRAKSGSRYSEYLQKTETIGLTSCPRPDLVSVPA